MTLGALIAVGAYGALVSWLIHQIMEIRRENRAEDRLMRHVLMEADAEWAEDEQWGIFADDHEDIVALPLANPLDVM